MSYTEPSQLRNKITRWWALVAGVTVLGIAVWYFSTLAIYLLLGLIVSIISRPIYQILERIKIKTKPLPAVLLAACSLALFWVIVLGFLSALVPLLSNQTQKIAQLNPHEILHELEIPLDQSIIWLEDKGILHFITDSLQPVAIQSTSDTLYVTDSTIVLQKPTSELPNAEAQLWAKKQHLLSFVQTELLRVLNYTKVSNVFTSVFNFLSSLLIGIGSVTFIAFFFLKDKDLFYDMVSALVPEKHERALRKVLMESRQMLSRYFLGIIAELTLVMTLTSIGLLVIGIDTGTAVTIGFFCGLFNIIPYVGPILGGIFGVLLGVTSHIDLPFYTELIPLLIKMVAVFSITQLLDNLVFQPYIFSNSVKAHPLEIFMVIFAGGQLAGVAGMIFAVPAYTFLRIVGKQFFTNFKIIRELTKNMDA